MSGAAQSGLGNRDQGQVLGAHPLDVIIVVAVCRVARGHVVLRGAQYRTLRLKIEKEMLLVNFFRKKPLFVIEFYTTT